MQNVKKRFLLEAKKRLPWYLIAVFFLWPLLSFLMAVKETLILPYYKATMGQAMLFAAGGMAILIPDIVIVGCLCFFICLVLFSFLASLEFISQNNSWANFIMEPVILFFTTLFGVSLYYPAIISHPIFSFLGILPVWFIILVLGYNMIALGMLHALPGHRISVALILFICSIAAPLPALYRNQKTAISIAPPPTVILGIDSLSQKDDLSHVREWTKANGGTWYTRAVSPGLLTNSVWTSILLMKPVSEHGIFHTFQSRPKSSKGSIVEAARNNGYYTISIFTDQLTCWIVSDYSFDCDRSGPKGWRQLATSIFENASVLLPIIKPILPRLSFCNPPNHAGSYTYSIDREFNEIFSQTTYNRPVLLIVHSGYPHVPCYPNYCDLSWEKVKKVLRSPANRVRDRGFDWQDVDRTDDAVPVRLWKVKRVQIAITDAIERSRFLKRGGKLILFSDHGDRIGLSGDNFHEERFYNVMFATFGFPVRDVNLSISLMDLGSILGLKQHEPFDPLVEYVNSDSSEWSILAKSANLNWDGSVDLDVELLSNIFKRLRSYRPWVTLSSGNIETNQSN